jgi:hypothetical protein
MMDLARNVVDFQIRWLKPAVIHVPGWQLETSGNVFQVVLSIGFDINYRRF